MNRSESIAEIAKALAKAQALIEPAPKDATNPHFRRKYSDLASVWEVCRGPITSCGLSILQIPEPCPDGGMQLLTMLMHTSGEFISSPMPLICGDSMQSLGSAITYARRYAMTAILGIVSEADDDGEAARRPERAEARDQRRPGRRDEERRPIPRDTQTGKAPTNGRELLAWANRQSKRVDYEIEPDLKAWAREQGFPGRLLDWNPGQVEQGYKFACRIIRGLRASAEGLPFDSVETFRIWLDKNGLDSRAHAFGNDNGFPGSALKWSFDQAIACYRALSEELAATAAN